MPAHIGFADNLKLGINFILANTMQNKTWKAARRMKGHHWSVLVNRQETGRKSREKLCRSYNDLRRELDKCDPETDRNTNVWCGEAEWELYLKPGTAFDITCRHYWEVFRECEMTLITHKGDRTKLKRIEAKPQGERMRVIWTDA